MTNSYQQFERLLDLISIGAASIVAIVITLKLAGLRWQRLSDGREASLIGWCLVVMLGPGVLLDLVRMQHSGWTIHVAIRCVAILLCVAFLIRDASQRRKRT